MPRRNKAQPLYLSGDAEKNPALAGEVASLRGEMLAAAEKASLPPRFDAVPHPDRPAMVITDTETGRAAVVPMFAYGATREALASLFA